MSLLDSLKVLLPTPENPQESTGEMEWAEVETKMGFALPPDYKDFINQYGSGSIDQFVLILNPFSKNQHLNLFRQRDVRLRANEQFVTEARQRDPTIADPLPANLIPCGVTDNGDVLYWEQSGPAMNWPIVVVASRAWRWRRFAQTLVEFLVSVLSRNITVDIFPDDFPTTVPEFHSM